MSGLRPAAFLDRDGVLNERAAKGEYVLSRAAFRWLPGAPEGLARLAKAGYGLVVVSNQRGIARGLLSWAALREIERGIAADLRALGVQIESYRYCPHELDEGCNCRKPAPGLLLSAADDLGLDIARSVMIGDEESDVEAGRAAGCFTIRLAPPGTPSAADLVRRDLASAAEFLVTAPP